MYWQTGSAQLLPACSRLDQRTGLQQLHNSALTHAAEDGANLALLLAVQGNGLEG